VLPGEEDAGGSFFCAKEVGDKVEEWRGITLDNHERMALANAAAVLRWDGQNADAIRLRARMFSPLSGTVEDAATGSAATPLAALLLSLTKDPERRYDITQGVEMGRPSLLVCSARRSADGIRASVGGGCVAVLKGEVSL